MGTIVGLMLMDRFSPRQMNITIGVICIVFVAFQFAKEQIFKAEGIFAPNHQIGIPCGIGAGITSTFANGAGPLIAMFLIPQRLPKEIYVGTTVLVFAWIDWIKFVFFIPDKLYAADGCLFGITFIFRASWSLDRSLAQQTIPEQIFIKVVYLFTFLAGLQLILK